MWSALGGTNGDVYALAVYDGALIAGGQFTTAGGVGASRIAQWDGTSWSALGSGIDSDVRALAVYDDALIAGGQFTTAGGVAVGNIARWDGTVVVGAGFGD